MTFVYCSECGFQNPESANYCSRCGALLQKGEPATETTQTLGPEEVSELAEHHERFCHVVRQVGLVMKVELFEALENVIEAAQPAPPL